MLDIQLVHDRVSVSNELGEGPVDEGPEGVRDSMAHAPCQKVGPREASHQLGIRDGLRQLGQKQTDLMVWQIVWPGQEFAEPIKAVEPEQ
ncbi:hypothetical protein RR42_s0624 [Cupriavidus basilensis]|uniref:Uncharacterized protein n=1 Tax=Cupriavidus basilensis TaxID=68895 RepID=A0A0C4YHY4_9BURK|nr:hypothetical protein RR42_s0624 [Cupriavidus basilensis]